MYLPAAAGVKLTGRLMNLDYNSLLLALSFAAMGLTITLMVIWLSARRDGLMLGWTVATVFIVCTIMAYSAYLYEQRVIWRLLSSTCMLISQAALFGTAAHFRKAHFSWKRFILPAVLTIGLVAPVMASPWDGLGFMVYNAVAGLMFITIGGEYFRGRAEAPAIITGMSALYVVTGISFLLCTLVLAVDGKLVLDGPPDNWAEDLSLIVAIASIAGVGGLSLSLNQGRLARQHRNDAMTDALTGLANRRALFSVYEKAPVSRRTAVVIFDLDDFKSINDRYGHAFGDEVLCRFAGILSDACQAGDMATRMGGEEFCLVMKRSSAPLAGLIAERIRDAFSLERFEIDGQMVACTVSAGVAFVAGVPEAIDSVIHRADEALYEAKRQGRNRVIFPRGLSLVS